MKKKRYGEEEGALPPHQGRTDIMSFRYYDVLEALYRSLEEWQQTEAISKQDVIDSVRERTLLLMSHVITTPLLGTAFAYPGDITDQLDAWLVASGSQVVVGSSSGAACSSSTTTTNTAS